MEEERIKIELPVEYWESVKEDIEDYKRSHEELKELLELMFENARFGIDEYDLQIEPVSEISTYLKIKNKDRYNKKLKELRERRKNNE